MDLPQGTVIKCEVDSSSKTQSLKEIYLMGLSC